MKLNVKQTVLVGLAFLAISSFWQFYDFSIPLILVNDYGVSDKVAGFIMSLDNIVALFLLPIFGSLSDKVVTKYGKRMPFIIIGTITTVFILLLIPYIVEHYSFTLFIVALCLLLLSIATYRSPAVALMPDVTIRPLRSKGNAIINLMGTIGGILALLLYTVIKTSEVGYYPLFIAISAIMLVSLVIMVLTVNENKLVAEMKEESKKYNIVEEDLDTITDNKLSPETRKSLLFILISVALWFMGYNAVTSAFSRYATIYIGLTEGNASLILMLANASALISFIPIGIISSKIGRKKTILAGVVLLTISFGTAFFYKTFTPLMYVNFILAGISWAAINVNSLPMVLEIGSGGKVGRYTGYYYSFSMSAQIITPTLSGFLFDLWGYGVLFIYAAIFVGLAFITMQFVKHGDYIQ